MKKQFFGILIGLWVLIPVSAFAQTDNEHSEDTDIPVPNTSIRMSGNNTLIVKGFNGQEIEIFNLTGTKISSQKVEGQEKSYTLNLQKGCYIVKIGKFVRKISVQ